MERKREVLMSNELLNNIFKRIKQIDAEYYTKLISFC